MFLYEKGQSVSIMVWGKGATGTGFGFLLPAAADQCTPWRKKISMRYNFSPWHDRPSHEFSAANFIPKEKSMPNLAPTFLWVFLIQFFFRNKGYDTIFILLFQIKRWLSTLDYLVLYGRYIYWGRWIIPVSEELFDAGKSWKKARSRTRKSCSPELVSVKI